MSLKGAESTISMGDSWRKHASSDLGILVLWAAAGVFLHTVTNGQYGFHRDELVTLDDSRSLDWGYVAYPPVTPFLARVAFVLFGPSLIGLRLFAAVALGLVLVLTGLVARIRTERVRVLSNCWSCQQSFRDRKQRHSQH